MANTSAFAYQGNGRCVVRSRDDAGQVAMDAPPHCGGSGENWTPGDWLGFAFAGCVIISMDNVARKHGFGVAGATVETEVQMGGGPPPKVTLLKVVVRLSGPLSPERVRVLEQAAHMCPIHNSMAAETEVRVEVIAQ